MTKHITLANGQTIAYTEVGTGEAIVWVHGLSSHKEIWERNTSIFGKYYRCITLDLPSHGESKMNVGTSSPLQLADMLLVFLEEMRIRKCVLVGHSMGGQIAIIAALKKPTMFSELILVAPAGCEQFTDAEKTIMRNFSSVGVVGTSWLAQNILNMKSHFSRLDNHEQQALDRISRMHDNRSLSEIAHTLSDCIGGMLRESVLDVLPRIKTPTLLLFGKADKLIPNRYFNSQLSTEALAKNIASQIPNCRLKLWDDAGHYLQFERASEVNMEIYKFLNRNIFG